MEQLLMSHTAVGKKVTITYVIYAAWQITAVSGRLILYFTQNNSRT